MPIYTKKGDGGETGLPGGRRIPKTNELFNVLGSLDQTSASIGVAVSHLKKGELHTKLTLQDVQSDLLSIGTYLASQNPEQILFKKQLKKKIKQFESQIDSWEKETGELKNFIIVGGSPAGASLHLSRTICRQAERSFHKLSKRPVEIAQYLNRLSDFLFQAARFVNFEESFVEPDWNKFQNTEKNS